MSREVCQFCNLSVKDKYTLKTHLLKNKRCLKNRGLTREKICLYRLSTCVFN